MNITEYILSEHHRRHSQTKLRWAGHNYRETAALQMDQAVLVSCLLLGCSTSQQHASVSQGRICLTSQQHAGVSQGRICLTSQQHAGVSQGRIYLTPQQDASVSQGRICSDNCICCHTEIQVADPKLSTSYWHQSNQSQNWPYHTRDMAE